MDKDLFARKCQSPNGPTRHGSKAQEVLERSSPSTNQVCLIALTFLALVYTLYFAAAVILPFVMALILASLLSPALLFMNRRLRVPRVIRALFDFCSSGRGMDGRYLVVVPASNWISKFHNPCQL